MAKPKITTLYGTLAVTSASTAGETDVFKADATNKKAYTNCDNDNVVPFDIEIQGYSKRILSPADIVLMDIQYLNRLIGATVIANKDDYLLENMPLGEIPEANAPAGGIFRDQATAAAAFDHALVDGAGMFALPEPWILHKGDLLNMILNIFAAPSSITASKTHLVRLILWGKTL